MTLGEKIRNYRLLKGLTQKELGMRVGFSEATADSRIRKYEKDLMAPKLDLRMKIANALDISITALSDNDISSSEDVMQILFQLESTYNAQVKKYDGKVCLEFDLNNTKFDLLNSYLNIWAARNAKYNPNLEYFDYQNWEAQFPGKLTEEWNDIRNSIFEKYNNAITDSYYEKRLAVTQVDLIHHLLDMLRNDVTMELDVISDSVPGPDPRRVNGLRFEFSCEELLSATSHEYINSFAVFLRDTYTINQLGYFIDYKVYQYKEGHQFVVKIRHPFIVGLLYFYNTYLKDFVVSERNKPEWATKTFDELFELQLKNYDEPLDSHTKK